VLPSGFARDRGAAHKPGAERWRSSRSFPFFLSLFAAWEQGLPLAFGRTVFLGTRQRRERRALVTGESASNITGESVSEENEAPETVRALGIRLAICVSRKLVNVAGC
jgi:hypothetical protein